VRPALERPALQTQPLQDEAWRETSPGETSPGDQLERPALQRSALERSQPWRDQPGRTSLRTSRSQPWRDQPWRDQPWRENEPWRDQPWRDQPGETSARRAWATKEGNGPPTSGCWRPHRCVGEGGIRFFRSNGVHIPQSISSQLAPQLQTMSQAAKSRKYILLCVPAIAPVCSMNVFLQQRTWAAARPAESFIIPQGHASALLLASKGSPRVMQPGSLQENVTFPTMSMVRRCFLAPTVASLTSPFCVLYPHLRTV